MLEKILGNDMKDFGECSRRFRGVFKKIPGDAPEDLGNVRADSGECLERFRGMLKQILGNVQKDSGESKFRFIS